MEQDSSNDFVSNKEIVKIPLRSLGAFRLWMYKNNYSRNTMIAYSKFIKKLLDSDKKCDELSEEKIMTFLETKTSTIINAAVRLFLKFLRLKYKKNIVIEDYVRVLKTNSITLPISKEEIHLIIKAMPDKYRLFTELLAESGMRISENASLKVEDFLWEDWKKDNTKYCDILLTKTKGNKTRIIPIPPMLVKKIVKHCRHPDKPGHLRKGLVFDFRHKKYIKRCKLGKKGITSRRNISPIFFEDLYVNKVCSTYRRLLPIVSEKAIGKRIHSHIFRHSYLSHLDAKGVRATIIRDVAGHSDISTTNKYLHNTPEQIRTEISEAGQNK